MIIIDLNQVMVSNLMVQLGFNKQAVELDENIVRHMILNSIRSYKMKFANEYGEIIIACDNRNYWRKEFFPYYKANRKKTQEESLINWKEVYTHFNKIRDELKAFFPYRVLDVESAEADDIIGTLCSNFAGEEEGYNPFNTSAEILIISGDRDFKQLQRFSNVKQYDPIRKKWLIADDPARYLKEHIIKGDRGDGIPNVLSPDNCFVLGQRSGRMTQGRFDLLMSTPPELLDMSIRRNYNRNEQLIDLSYTPERIRTQVMDQYEDQAGKKRDKLMNYFIQFRLKNLMESLNEF